MGSVRTEPIMPAGPSPTMGYPLWQVYRSTDTPYGRCRAFASVSIPDPKRVVQIAKNWY